MRHKLERLEQRVTNHEKAIARLTEMLLGEPDKPNPARHLGNVTESQVGSAAERMHAHKLAG